LHLWYCLTMERKVILVSSQHSILTVCSEILNSLLYPMKWSHLYVPLLPKFLCPILDAPVPYLCGVTRDNWMNVQKFVCDETIVVDLDRNSVMFGQRTIELPPVPGKHFSKLQRNLQQIAGHLFWRGRGLETEYQLLVENKISQCTFKEIAKQKGERVWREKLQTLDQAFNLQYTPDSEHLLYDKKNDEEQNQWDRLQEAFLRFFVAVLKNYRKYLHVPDNCKMDMKSSSDSKDWLTWGKKHTFERDSFISSQKPEYCSYLSELCSTQQFDDFITKRLYNPDLPDIIFFDQSIDAKLNRSRLKLKKLDTPFLQSAKAHKQLEPFVAVEPNTSNLPEEAPFIYKTWPEKFNLSQFCRPRPIPSMITAEFDRQKSLLKQLQMNRSPCAEKGAHLVDLYGSDYDSSPEGMLFTIFFFTYSAVIGREWQEYQLKRIEIENCSPILIAESSPNIHTMQIRNDESIASSQSSIRTDFSMGLCGGGSIVCPKGVTVIDDAVSYVTSKSPCPDINNGAQTAYDSLSNFAQSLDPTKACRNKSLLDNDDAFEEYEEMRAVAVAQLDLAFDALQIMKARGLCADPDVFKSLMEACGRCGDARRAFELIEIMKRDGLVANQNILVCFIASFAHNQDEHPIFPHGGDSSDAYSDFLRKKLHKMNGISLSKNFSNIQELSDEKNNFSTNDLSDSESETSIEHLTSATFLQIFASNLSNSKSKKVRKKKSKKRQSKKVIDNMSDRFQKQLLLGESLLDFLYPDISIDTYGDACPRCSNIMKEEDIVSGWQECDFQDFTTCCPLCCHRFVSRFKVSCSSPTFEGSQGPGTPLFCAFLSPWVLRKELGHIIGLDNSIDQILDPSWRSGRDVKAAIWWNLIVMFKRYRLPFSFLLQGSFQNRLINPVPQD